jgi:hypothetical protein
MNNPINLYDKSLVSIDSILFNINNISINLFHKIDKQRGANKLTTFKNHQLSYGNNKYTDNNKDNYFINIQSASQHDKDNARSYITIDSGKINNKNKVSASVTVHLNKFIRFTYPNNSHIDKKTVFNDLNELLTYALGFTKTTLDFNKVIIHRIDYAIDMLM